MLKGLALGCCAALLAACSSSVELSTASPTPSNPAESPAANLRVHLDLLFDEHTMTLGKLALAAAAGRKEEFGAYAGVLAANGTDVTALFKSALGATTGDQVGLAWSAGNSYAVDYIVAASTHDQAKSDAAMQKLAEQFVPELSGSLTSTLSAPTQNVPALAAADVTAFKSVVDDTVAGSYPTAFTDLAVALTGTTAFADLLAGKIAQQFPDRFPGDPLDPAAARRAGLAVALSAQARYYTMLTQAIVAGAEAERVGATQALATNTPYLLQVSSGWSTAVALISSYAQNGDATSRQSVTNLGTREVNEAFQALLPAVDDQRAKAYDKLGPDDRTAAAAFAAVADALPAR